MANNSYLLLIKLCNRSGITQDITTLSTKLMEILLFSMASGHRIEDSTISTDIIIGHGLLLTCNPAPGNFVSTQADRYFVK